MWELGVVDMIGARFRCWILKNHSTYHHHTPNFTVGIHQKLLAPNP